VVVLGADAKLSLIAGLAKTQNTGSRSILSNVAGRADAVPNVDEFIAWLIWGVARVVGDAWLVPRVAGIGVARFCLVAGIVAGEVKGFKLVAGLLMVTLTRSARTPVISRIAGRACVASIIITGFVAWVARGRSLGSLGMLGLSLELPELQELQLPNSVWWLNLLLDRSNSWKGSLEESREQSQGWPGL
jgi:hypothetical protein